MLEFIDPPAERSKRWGAWAEGSEHGAPQPVRLARLQLADDGGRWCGVFVTPARVAMGLRGWEDAYEGVERDEPWVLFDIEKVTRMMLHQSGLAFELLGSAACWSRGNFPARRIAGSAVTAGILDYYRDITAVLESSAQDRWRWRSLATALLLAREGAVAFDLSTVLEALDDDRLAPLGEGLVPGGRVAAQLRAELSDHRLPESPSDYAWLNTYIPEARLQEWA